METPYRFLGEGLENDDNNTLKIYCRLKPVIGSEPCFTAFGTTKLCTNPPRSAHNNKQLQFTFKYVFPPNSTQKAVFDEVAFPLVQRVLQGQNSLLFTYGNTGSGKTYTMKGTLKEGGVMPRCLDVIFNSVSQKLAKKYIFKSDRFNGYEIQSEKEATTDAHQALRKQIDFTKGIKAKLGKKHNSDPDLAGRLIDPTQILMINNKNTFAIFITFIEIYNNAAYDLLDDSLEELHKPPQAKMIREDSKKNMFVHGVTEVEVTSTEEAYEIFYKGLKKRRVAQTLLNAQSSRSHSVFSIRVVQANLCNLKNVKLVGYKPGKNIPITVGQLSLVDLAGSERTSRTQNTGKNLMEAGNINNSLMTLRQCFDAIKENQRGGCRIVPYRDSKLTTLFKNFFEGDGHISMISCINPHIDDYDESLQVLKFAESSQEVLITVSRTKMLELEEANRKARLLDCVQVLDDQENAFLRDYMSTFFHETEMIQQMLPPVCLPDPKEFAKQKKMYEDISAGIDYINSKMNKPASSEHYENLMSDLISYIRKGSLCSLEAENLKVSLRQEMDTRITVEGERNLLKRKLEESNNNVKKYKRELMEKEKTALKAKVETNREKEKMMLKKNVIKEKFNSEIERLKRQRTELEMEIQNKGDKLARVQHVLSDEIISTTSTPSVASCRAKFEKIATPSSIISTPRITHSEMRPTTRRANIAVSNRRHRRSRSTGDVWVEHKPAMPVPLNTILQPSLPKRRSITKLIDAKQVTQGASKYCLMTQTQDSDGDLETRLYKGDVIPTSGGGAQVLFNDVEVLKQVSPDASSKKAPVEEAHDPEPSCSYAIEGHKARLRRFKQ